MWDTIERWILAGVGLIVAAFAWTWNRQVSRTDTHAERLDALERSTVSRDEFNSTVASLRKDFRDSEERISADIQHGQDQTNKALDRLTDRLLEWSRVDRSGRSE